MDVEERTLKLWIERFGPELWVPMQDEARGFSFSSWGRMRRDGRKDCLSVQCTGNDSPRYYFKVPGHDVYQQSVSARAMLQKYFPDGKIQPNADHFQLLRAELGRGWAPRKRQSYVRGRTGLLGVCHEPGCNRRTPNYRCDKCKAKHLARWRKQGNEYVEDALESFV